MHFYPYFILHIHFPCTNVFFCFRKCIGLSSGRYASGGIICLLDLYLEEIEFLEVQYVRKLGTECEEITSRFDVCVLCCKSTQSPHPNLLLSSCASSVNTETPPDLRAPQADS